jgi:hypothetical protein
MLYIKKRGNEQTYLWAKVTYKKKFQDSWHLDGKKQNVPIFVCEITHFRCNVLLWYESLYVCNLWKIHSASFDTHNPYVSKTKLCTLCTAWPLNLWPVLKRPIDPKPPICHFRCFFMKPNKSPPYSCDSSHSPRTEPHCKFTLEWSISFKTWEMLNELIDFATYICEKFMALLTISSLVAEPHHYDPAPSAILW